MFSLRKIKNLFFSIKHKFSTPENIDYKYESISVDIINATDYEKLISMDECIGRLMSAITICIDISPNSIYINDFILLLKRYNFDFISKINRDNSHLIFIITGCVEKWDKLLSNLTYQSANDILIAIYSQFNSSIPAIGFILLENSESPLDNYLDTVQAYKLSYPRFKSESPLESYCCAETISILCSTDINALNNYNMEKLNNLFNLEELLSVCRIILAGDATKSFKSIWCVPHVSIQVHSEGEEELLYFNFRLYDLIVVLLEKSNDTDDDDDIISTLYDQMYTSAGVLVKTKNDLVPAIELFKSNKGIMGIKANGYYSYNSVDPTSRPKHFEYLQQDDIDIPMQGRNINEMNRNEYIKSLYEDIDEEV